MGETLVLEFTLGHNPKRNEPQWQAEGRDGETRVRYVPIFGSRTPTAGEKWLCRPIDYLYISPDSRRAIVKVELLKVANGRCLRRRAKRTATT